MALDINKEIQASVIANKELTNAILELYKISKNNFDSSQLLYKSKLYSDSIFMLEQCVEKLTKAMLLYIGMTPIDELHGHYPIIIITKRVETLILPELKKAQDLAAIFNVLDSIMPEKSPSKLISEEVKKIVKFVEEYRDFTSPEKVRKIVLMDKENIDAMLKTIYKIEHDKSKKKKVYSFIDSETFNDQIKTAKQAFIRFVEELAKAYNSIDVAKAKEEISHIEDSKLREVFKGIMDFFFDIIIPLYSLLGLSKLLSPHIETTRYSNNRAGIITTETYNENLGIVKAYPRIVKIVKYNINFLDELFSKLKENDVGIVKEVPD
ncbi:MAG: HEPN domain-containing protein [Candidatus Bathyarchaeia archaeon]